MVVFDPAEDFFSSILNELRELRRTGALCDVTLTIGQARLPAHRCVLATGSHYFHTLFLGQFKESSEPNIDVSLAEVTDDFKALDLVVEFLYTGTIEIDDDNLEVIVKLSTFLLIDRLTDYCMDYMNDQMNLGTWLDRYLFAVEHGLSDIEMKGRLIVGSRFHDYFIHQDRLDLSPDEVLLLLRNGVFQHFTVSDITTFVFRWLKDDATDEHFSVVNQFLDKVDLKRFDCLTEHSKCGIKEYMSDYSIVPCSNSSEEKKALEKLQLITKKLLPRLRTAGELCEVKSGQSASGTGTSNPAPDQEEFSVCLSPKQCIVDALQRRDTFLSYPTFTESIFTLCCYIPSLRTWFHIQDFGAEQAIADLPKHLGRSSHTIVPALYREKLVLICNDDSNDGDNYVKVYYYNLRRKSWKSRATRIRVYNDQDSDQRRCVQDYCVINGNGCLYIIFKVLVFEQFSSVPDGEYFLGCRLKKKRPMRKIFETEIERDHACINSEIQANFSSVSNELIFTSCPKVDTEAEHSDQSVSGYNYVFVVNLSEATPTIEILSKVSARDSEPQLTGVKILQTPSHFYIVYDGTAQSPDWDVRIVYEYKFGSLSLTQPQEDSQHCLSINQDYGHEGETFPCCEELTVSFGKTLWIFDSDGDFFSNLNEVKVEENKRPSCEEGTPRSTHEEETPRSTHEEETPRSTHKEETPRSTHEEETPRSTHEEETPRSTHEEGTQNSICEENTQKTTLEKHTSRSARKEEVQKSTLEEFTPGSTHEEDAPRSRHEEDTPMSTGETQTPPLRFTFEEHTPPPFSCVTRMAVGKLPMDIIEQMTPLPHFLHKHCKAINSDD